MPTRTTRAAWSAARVGLTSDVPAGHGARRSFSRAGDGRERQAGKPIRLTAGFDVPGTIDNGATQRLLIPSAAAAEQIDLAAVPPHADPTMLARGFSTWIALSPC